MKQDIPFVAEHRERLERYVSLSAAIGARVDYVQGGGGNTSVKLNDSLMAIKASGYKLSDIGLDKGYAVMSYQPLKDFYLEHAAADFDDVEASGAALARQKQKRYPASPLSGRLLKPASMRFWNDMLPIVTAFTAIWLPAPKCQNRS